MALLLVNVSLQVEVEVADFALQDDTHINQARRLVFDNLSEAFKNNSTRFTTVEPATLVVGEDVYDL
jgi:hypothetical protein